MKSRNRRLGGHTHRSGRSNWLRAAVLGADDGVVSTSALMLGVLAASNSPSAVLVAGIAGLVSGSISMAAGEFVSVSSQRDAQKADLAMEARALRDEPEAELAELTRIYIGRGLEPDLAATLAARLHEKDALAAHARDEIGIDPSAPPSARAAAFASAVAFSVGAGVPVIAAYLGGGPWPIVASSLIALAVFGATGASIGGGNRVVAAIRVLVGGSLAMAVTALVGHVFGLALS